MNSFAMATDSPRFEDRKRLLIAGLTQRYAGDEASAGIPEQWQRFATYLGRIAGQVGKVAYGAICDTDEQGNIEYLSGVEVSDFSSVPRSFGLLCLAPQRCAVFLHRGHISSIRNTWSAIWNKWLPESDQELVGAHCFERYGESFDPLTGTGGVEIWIPVVRPVERRDSLILPHSAATPAAALCGRRVNHTKPIINRLSQPQSQK